MPAPRSSKQTADSLGFTRKVKHGRTAPNTRLHQDEDWSQDEWGNTKEWDSAVNSMGGGHFTIDDVKKRVKARRGGFPGGLGHISQPQFGSMATSDGGDITTAVGGTGDAAGV